MKKYFFLLAATLIATQFTSCSSDDKDSAPVLEDKYMTIENAAYKSASFPSATTSETLQGVDMSSQVMNGAMNYITVMTEQAVEKFYVGIKNVPGYYEYVPTSTRSVNYYVIPVMISDNYTGNCVIVISGLLENGQVTAPVETQLSYLETQEGALEVKLAFNNNKDVDLHLYTPGGQLIDHIYYGNRGGGYYDDDDEGEEYVEYGLDIDSNADCAIDGINKENIYIPQELIENGEYTVKVDMYNNCDPSIPTSWNIIVRYKGKVITPTTGYNPASGVYPAGAGNGDMTTVMKFKITDGHTTRATFNPNAFRATPLNETDIRKMEQAKYRLNLGK